jgi:hypothetical protein
MERGGNYDRLKNRHVFTEYEPNSHISKIGQSLNFETESNQLGGKR